MGKEERKGRSHWVAIGLLKVDPIKKFLTISYTSIMPYVEKADTAQYNFGFGPGTS